jgi:hypothetical protein
MWIMVEPVAEILFGIRRSPTQCYRCNTDSVSDGTTAPSGNVQQPSSSGNYGNKEAGDFVPADKEWGQWS